MPIKLGVVGLSNNGKSWASLALIPPLFKEPLKDLYQVTAISTSNAASASASAEHYSPLSGTAIKPFHGPTNAIAMDPDVDAVAVVVQAKHHVNAALPVIEAGKSLFLEWPAGRTLAETRQLLKKAQQKNVRSMVGMQGWQTPLVKKIKEIVDSGKIGKVTSTAWVSTKRTALPFWSPWAAPSSVDTLDPELGSGLADIWIAHNIGLIIRALGPLASLSASAVTAHPEILVGPSIDSKPGENDAYTVPAKAPDQYGVTGVLASGGLFVGSWRVLSTDLKAGPALFWTIDGTLGDIRVEIDMPGASFPHVYPPSEFFVNGERVDLAEENQGLSMPSRAWAAFAKGEEGGYPTLGDALVTRQHVEAIKQSAETGKSVVPSSL